MDVDIDKWFRCEVDKKEFKELCKKSDWQGFKHMLIYFSSLVFFGYLAYATWGTWWSLLFFLIYGNIWGCSDAMWHETGHRTAFKSKSEFQKVSTGTGFYPKSGLGKYGQHRKCC